MKPLNDKQKRERKFLLVLPLLCLPFLSLAFWSLGGGKGQMATGVESQKGLNMSLPEARVETGELNKLESYEEAERKALKLRELRRMDPFVEIIGQEDKKEDQIRTFSPEAEMLSLEETENSVRQKLAELEGLIAGAESKKDQDLLVEEFDLIEPDVFGKNRDLELNRHESRMTSVLTSEMEDPEMKQIDSMLDKLLDVQYPQRVQERMKKIREASLGERYAVSIAPEEGLNKARLNGIGGASGMSGESNGFYTLEEQVFPGFSEIKPAISARVTSDQEIVDGASIELELDQSVFISGEKLPKGTSLTGTCSLNGERLLIHVGAIRSGNLIIPVNLEAKDLDALPGIRIPNAITRTAVKQGSGDGIQSMNMMTMSNSWEAQASMAGMEAVKGVFSKKAKLVRVTVKAGHPLLLADTATH